MKANKFNLAYHQFNKEVFIVGLYKREGCFARSSSYGITEIYPGTVDLHT